MLICLLKSGFPLHKTVEAMKHIEKMSVCEMKYIPGDYIEWDKAKCTYSGFTGLFNIQYMLKILQIKKKPLKRRLF